MPVCVLCPSVSQCLYRSLCLSLADSFSNFPCLLRSVSSCVSIYLIPLCLSDAPSPFSSGILWLILCYLLSPSPSPSSFPAPLFPPSSLHCPPSSLCLPDPSPPSPHICSLLSLIFFLLSSSSFCPSPILPPPFPALLLLSIDYQSLRIGGLIIAGILFILGILIVLSEYPPRHSPQPSICRCSPQPRPVPTLGPPGACLDPGPAPPGLYPRPGPAPIPAPAPPLSPWLRLRRAPAGARAPPRARRERPLSPCLPPTPPTTHPQAEGAGANSTSSRGKRPSCHSFCSRPGGEAGTPFKLHPEALQQHFY